MAGELEVALDSNAAIALIGNDRSLRVVLRDAGLITLPVIVFGERYHGALASNRISENLARLEDFLRIVDIAPCDSLTALHYGVIRQQLRRKGRPIPDNDLWIAALCLQHGLTLITRDAHFDHIEELTVVSW